MVPEPERATELPTAEETITILRGLREKYEAHHGVHIGGEDLGLLLGTRDDARGDAGLVLLLLDVTDEGPDLQWLIPR